MDYNINFPNLGIYLDHVGKNIMLGNFSIAYYGLVIACGMLIGIILVSYVARKLGQDPDLYFDLAIFGIIFGVAGARAYYVIFQWNYYKDDLLSILNLREGGLAIYGGIIAGCITVIVFAKVRKQSIMGLLDVSCYGMVVGQVIGRWGNFFNREAFGGYTNNLLAMQLPVSAVRQNEITQQQWDNCVTINGITYIQAHPTFLYESLWNLGLLFLLLLLLKGRRFKGQLALTYLLGYGVGRFWIESLRTDQLLIPGTGLPVSRVLAGTLVCISLLALLIGFITSGTKNTLNETEM